jgi:hypothetical protein
VVVVAVASLLAVDLPSSQAVAGLASRPARGAAGEVRIYENGGFIGSGTLVDRSWVLTAAHVFERPDNPAIYSFRFGTTTDADDANSNTNLRAVDRVVFNPSYPDLLMVHFADPVPADVWIPSLATAEPPRLGAAEIFGWGPAGHALNRALGLIIDPVATENAAAVRASMPAVAAAFPGDIQPMVADLGSATGPGDSGAGVYRLGVLTGVHIARISYQHLNASGNLFGSPFMASWEQPVWSYRQWIHDTINGAGPSSTPPPSNDELKRRRLTEGSVTRR